ncbi:MAG: hypothetical protein PHT83_04410 [Bacilli bacterium]|nr:hypothetical protein [Bacilli bacterium]
MGKNKQKEINVTKIENEVLEANQKLDVKNNTFEEAYSEQLDFDFRFKFDDGLDKNQLKNLVRKHYIDLEKNKNNLIQKYYIYRIFEYSISKKDELVSLLDTIETHISLINVNYEKLKKEIERYEIDDKQISSNYIYDRLNQFHLFNLDLEKNLEDVQKIYYKKLRAVSFSICSNKSNVELNNLVLKIKEFILEYRDLDTAVSYITYHSVALINDTVSQILKILDKRSKENYDVKYFINSDVLVCLSMSEWINLFNKFKYAINLYNIDKDIYKEFYKYFDKLELFYIILLINFERESDV